MKIYVSQHILVMKITLMSIKVYENGLPINIRTDIIKDKYVFIYDDETKEKVM